MENPVENIEYKELIINTVAGDLYQHFGGKMLLKEKVLVTTVAGYTFMYPLENVTRVRIEG